jgi:hypothetical protein
MSGKPKKKKPARMGRPLIGWEARSEYIRIRLTKTERTLLNRDARAAGLSISDLLMKPYRPVRAGGKGGR